ncbi:MAG: hypothetical protein II145_08610 [Selenomonas sp.]|nr:hypothetical protein [Selenomonas sp.]
MLNQTARIISTYSADTFGVCSALFELGGMVVIHDPSGCNSTYTTHDEPRWYDHDSMIYVSALNEQDAILGNDTRLLTETIETVQQQKPAFVCLIASQIPFMIGTDMQALARIVEQNTGVPAFTLPTNNMHYYAQGAWYAFRHLAEHITRASKGQEAFWAKDYANWQPTQAPKDGQLRLNLLGVTPQDFSINGSDTSLRQWAEEHDFYVQSCWAMGSSLAEIEHSTAADVNLVLSYGGLGAAAVMAQACGIPSIVGVPIGALREVLAQNVRQAAGTHNHASTCQRTGDSAGLLIGESVYAQSLAQALEAATGQHYRVIVPMETDDALLLPDTLRVTDEVDLEPLFQHAGTIIGDPMYAPIMPKSARFVSLPHEGFSGRLYEHQIPDLIAPHGFVQFVTQL